MRNKKRALRHTVFIACEGKNTEPVYFEKIVQEIADDGQLAVTIYPDKNDQAHSSHAIGLIEEAKSRMDDFDEVWAVFDKDGYTKHPEAFAAAAAPKNGKRVHIAFPSISFEEWVLLHFEKSMVPYQKSADIIGRLLAQEYFPGYEKKEYIDTYGFLKHWTGTALENAAWQRFQHILAGTLPAGPVYSLNPYTDVSVLVGRLLGLHDHITWSAAGHALVMDDRTVTVNLNAGMIEITVLNRSAAAVVFN